MDVDLRELQRELLRVGAPDDGGVALQRLANAGRKYLTASRPAGQLVSEHSIDQWLRQFQRDHGELERIGRKELRELAYALHDDIPLGYEASMRLANWLLVATNRKPKGRKAKR